MDNVFNNYLSSPISLDFFGRSNIMVLEFQRKSKDIANS
jgi:hypothetical protein